jgi:hypothetical protein
VDTLVLTVVLAASGYIVDRLHGIFDSHNTTSAASGISNDIIERLQNQLSRPGAGLSQ